MMFDQFRRIFFEKQKSTKIIKLKNLKPESHAEA